MRENSCRWDLSCQEKLPNHNHRQTKIAQKLIEKESLTAVAQSLAVSTSIVIRKLKEFEFKTDLNWLPDHMSGESYSLRRDCDRLEIKKMNFFHWNNWKILDKLLSYSEELRQYYEPHQLLLFHFQERQSEHFFELIEESISSVHPFSRQYLRYF